MRNRELEFIAYDYSIDNTISNTGRKLFTALRCAWCYNSHFRDGSIRQSPASRFLSLCRTLSGTLTGPLLVQTFHIAINFVGEPSSSKINIFVIAKFAHPIMNYVNMSRRPEKSISSGYSEPYKDRVRSPSGLYQVHRLSAHWWMDGGTKTTGTLTGCVSFAKQFPTSIFHLLNSATIMTRL